VEAGTEVSKHKNDGRNEITVVPGRNVVGHNKTKQLIRVRRENI